jgi:hypothetical protein
MPLADAQRLMAENWVEVYNAMLTAAPPKPTIALAVVPSHRADFSCDDTIATSALSVVIATSRYRSVSAATLAGSSCSAQARLPTGSTSTAQGFTRTKTADASGPVSWTYRTSPTTKPGTGTHTATCTLNGITRKASAAFSVA